MAGPGPGIWGLVVQPHTVSPTLRGTEARRPLRVVFHLPTEEDLSVKEPGNGEA